MIETESGVGRVAIASQSIRLCLSSARLVELVEQIR
jgi:hypothetical protein